MLPPSSYGCDIGCTTLASFLRPRTSPCLLGVALCGPLQWTEHHNSHTMGEPAGRRPVLSSIRSCTHAWPQSLVVFLCLWYGGYNTTSPAPPTHHNPQPYTGASRYSPSDAPFFGHKHRTCWIVCALGCCSIGFFCINYAISAMSPLRITASIKSTHRPCTVVTGFRLRGSFGISP